MDIFSSPLFLPLILMSVCQSSEFSLSDSFLLKGPRAVWEVVMAKTAGCPWQPVVSFLSLFTARAMTRLFSSLPWVSCCHVTHSHYRVWVDMMHTSSNHEAGQPSPHRVPSARWMARQWSWGLENGRAQGGRMLGPHPHVEESDPNQK